jgi:hypothetical protein
LKNSSFIRANSFRRGLRTMRLLTILRSWRGSTLYTWLMIITDTPPPMCLRLKIKRWKSRRSSLSLRADAQSSITIHDFSVFSYPSIRLRTSLSVSSLSSMKRWSSGSFPKISSFNDDDDGQK